MFESTMLLTLTIGLLLSLLFIRFRLRRLVLLAYHIPYRFWRSYDELYDAAETRFTYEMVDDGTSKNYTDFLIRYRKLRPHTQSRFKSLWNAFAWQVGRDYGIVLTTSLVLFWNDYLAFAAPFVLVHVASFTYLHFHKQYRLDFFAILMIGTMLLAHQKNK